VPLSAAQYHRLPSALLYDGVLPWLYRGPAPRDFEIAFLASAAVRRRPPQRKPPHQTSTDISERAPPFAKLVVSLAVKNRRHFPGGGRKL